MKAPARPADEVHRIQALRQYSLLDTPPDRALDDLTALAAHICRAPIALISLVDEHRQWFKARVGVATEGTDRDISFCGHAILQREPFIVTDALLDERFADNPLVTGEPHVRFYAGVPLITPADAALGALCIMDHVPRELDSSQLGALAVLGRQAVALMESRLHTRDLIQSQERLRIVTENARVGLVIVDEDRRYVYANTTYATILGLPSSEIIGRRVRDVLAGVYEEQIRPRLDRAFGGERVAYELHKPTAGTGCHYAVSYEPTVMEGGSQFVVVVITDITERRRAEADRDLQHAELKLILDAVPALVFYKDREGRFLRVNRELANLVGVPPEAFIGKTDTEMGSSVGERYRRDDLRVMTTGEPLRHQEEPLQTVDGTRWLMTEKVPHRNDAGEIVGVVGFAVDITARKSAEEGIRRLNAELEDRVFQRTAELEAANKELESFSYSVSHDLRAPLRAMDGFARMVAEDYGPRLPAEGQRHLQKIRDGAKRMSMLIDDLLRLSSLSRSPLVHEPVDTVLQVRAALEELTAGQGGREIQILMGDLPPSEGDPHLLKQLWVNLLSNAFKYTSKRPQAVIEIGSGKESDATVYFVRDNGTGFDMRYAAKLFGVFQRLHRQDEFEGTGVGLAIVQRIVQRHGGRVWADAAVGRGATFYFTLNEAARS